MQTGAENVLPLSFLSNNAYLPATIYKVGAWQYMATIAQQISLTPYFTGNSASYGGAVYQDHYNAIYPNCVFYANSAFQAKGIYQ